MKKKSKLITFLLSFVPGLGHIYLGLLQRGIVFLLATAFVLIGGFFFAMMHIFYEPVPFAALPFIWLAALIDSFVLLGRINRDLANPQAGPDSGRVWQILEEELKGQNSKILATTFSIIPGAGHMYLGQMSKGIQLMAAFFLTLYLSDFLRISLLLMFAPILWFYSIFDVLHKVSNPKTYHEATFMENFIQQNQFSRKAGKYLGIGLVAVGLIMIFNSILMPQLARYFDPQIREFFRTGVIAILFIAGGIRLMIGSKETKQAAEMPVNTAVTDGQAEIGSKE